jgi:hypothetical protein
VTCPPRGGDVCQLVEDVLVGCGEVWQECHTPSDIRALETRHLEAGLTNALSFFKKIFVYFFHSLQNCLRKKKKIQIFTNNARVYGKCPRNNFKKTEETIKFANFSRAKCFFFFNFSKNERIFESPYL